jgi:hypothetical protein
MASIGSYVPQTAGAPQGLADILERVLDKGVVIAGDIQVNLLDIELLTIKVRLLIASADTAQQMGIDWWQRDPFLSSSATESDRVSDGDTKALAQRVRELEAVLERVGDLPAGNGARASTQQKDGESDDG